MGVSPDRPGPADPFGAGGGQWISLVEVERESGLHRALVNRFVPPVDTPSGPMFHAHHIAVARFVKQLTEIGASAEAIDVAVKDALDRPASEFGGRPTPQFVHESGGRDRRGVWVIAGAAAAVALVAGGMAGGLIGSGGGNNDAASAPAPAAAQITPTIASKPDPVCAEWTSKLNSYNARRADWAKTDPAIPANRWSPAQRALTTAVIPVLTDEADELQRLAGQAQDPLLATLLRAQALYEDTYADKLPNYRPGDHRYWKAFIAFSNAVSVVCTGQ